MISKLQLALEQKEATKELKVEKHDIGGVTIKTEKDESQVFKVASTIC